MRVDTHVQTCIYEARTAQDPVQTYRAAETITHGASSMESRALAKRTSKKNERIQSAPRTSKKNGQTQ